MERTYPRAVLLTGATGVVGSAVLGELLKEPDSRVYLPVRGTSSAEARDRVVAVLRFLGVDPENPSLWKDRLSVSEGDLNRPDLGLRPEIHQRWVREVRQVIHAAGNVKLNQTLEASRKDAIASTQNILHFIDQCRRHQPFEKLDHLSTVGVCGRWDGPVPERPLPRPREFRNTYEAAKAEAEDLVWTAMQSGLPATLHRPSMVVGDSKTGRTISFQIFYQLLEFMTGIRSWGVVPDFGEVHLDIVPIDYVAQAVVLSNRFPESAGRVFHLCSGPGRVLTARDMSLRLRDLLSERGWRLPSLKVVSPSRLRRWFSRTEPLLPTRLRQEMKAVPFLFSYLDNVQVFENEQTDRFFSPHGLKVPSVDSYLRTIVDYYLSVRRTHAR